MNKFEKQLEKWNNGTLRGAQAKLAKVLEVSTATVALWATGKRHPSKGYVSKMAQLFGLDIYQVARLFLPLATAYADLVPQRQAFSLHDEASTPFSYPPHAPTSTTKMISLPLFTQLTLQSNSQAREWWNIPLSSAKGTSFLFALPDDQNAQRILFVRASTQWENNTIMLARRRKTYHLVRVFKRRGEVSLKSLQGDFLPKSSYQPLGIVTRQISSIHI